MLHSLDKLLHYLYYNPPAWVVNTIVPDGIAQVGCITLAIVVVSVTVTALIVMVLLAGVEHVLSDVL